MILSPSGTRARRAAERLWWTLPVVPPVPPAPRLRSPAWLLAAWGFVYALALACSLTTAAEDDGETARLLLVVGLLLVTVLGAWHTADRYEQDNYQQNLAYHRQFLAWLKEV